MSFSFFLGQCSQFNPTVCTHSAQDAAATQTPKSTEKIATVHMKATLVLLTSSSSSSLAGGQGTTGDPPSSVLVPFLQCSLALRHHYLVHGLRSSVPACCRPHHQRALSLTAGREMEKFSSSATTQFEILFFPNTAFQEICRRNRACGHRYGVTTHVALGNSTGYQIGGLEI